MLNPAMPPTGAIVVTERGRTWCWYQCRRRHRCPAMLLTCFTSNRAVVLERQAELEDVTSANRTDLSWIDLLIARGSRVLADLQVDPPSVSQGKVREYVRFDHVELVALVVVHHPV